MYILHVKRSDKILPWHWNCAIGWWGQGQHNKLCLVRALIPQIRLISHSKKLYTLIFYSYTIPICLASIFHKTRVVKISCEYRCHG